MDINSVPVELVKNMTARKDQIQRKMSRHNKRLICLSYIWLLVTHSKGSNYRELPSPFRHVYISLLYVMGVVKIGCINEMMNK